MDFNLFSPFMIKRSKKDFNVDSKIQMVKFNQKLSNLIQKAEYY